MKKTITTELEVKQPMTPNFILVGEDNTPLPISDFTDEELQEIGRKWTEELIKKSNR